jgi:cbb3-type cytochrome oxidase subunit 3
MKNKIKIYSILIVLLILFVGVIYFVESKQINCEPIDYSNTSYWNEQAQQGLYPIRDYKGDLIKYPVGCE